MKKVEDYERIRKAYHIEGLSIREISRRYKHGRRLIRKALEHAAPEPLSNQPAPECSEYWDPIRSGSWSYWKKANNSPENNGTPGTRSIRSWQKKDISAAKGSVHNFICRTKKKLQAGKAYLPLEFDAGQDAQVDWGEAVVIMAGMRGQSPVFCHAVELFPGAVCESLPISKTRGFFGCPRVWVSLQRRGSPPDHV